MNAIERLLSVHRAELQLDERGLGGDLHTILVTPSYATSRHVVGLVLAGSDPAVRLVVKAPRRPGDDAGVRHEAAVLTALADLGEERAPRAPEALGLLPLDAATVALVETGVAGTPLGPELVRGDRDAAVAAGLASLAALPTTGTCDAAWYDMHVAEPVARLLSLVPLGAAVGRRTDEVLARLRDAGLPAVLEHGDASHPNLLLGSDGRLGLLDWERSRREGLPGNDVVYFLAYVADAVTGAATIEERVAAFGDAFTARDAWARPLLGRVLRDRGVDEALLPALVVACWARAAATLVDRVGAGSPVLADVVRADRDVALWLHCLDRVNLLAGRP